VTAFNASTPFTASQVAATGAPAYLHAAYRSHSLGHLLRDNLGLVIVNLAELGLVDDHDLIIHSNLLPGSSLSTPMIAKYGALVSPRVLSWQKLRSQRTLPRYLHFPDLVVGSLLFRLHRLRLQTLDRAEREVLEDEAARQPGVAYGEHWLSATVFAMLREAAYARLGLPLQAVSHDLPARVLIGDKLRGDKRRIVNAADLVTGLALRFGDRIEASRVVFQRLDVRSQLRELSRTTVFITPVGR